MVEKNLSLLGRKKAVKNLQEGRLSGAIGADQSNEFPFPNLKRNILKHPFFVITEGDGLDFDHNVFTTFLVFKR
jgi:hypothetical protein